MTEDSSNILSNEPITDWHEKKKVQKRQYERETEERLLSIKNELKELQDVKVRAMIDAGMFAGNLGLFYDPKLNTFFRTIVVDVDPMSIAIPDPEALNKRLSKLLAPQYVEEPTPAGAEQSDEEVIEAEVVGDSHSASANDPSKHDSANKPGLDLASLFPAPKDRPARPEPVVANPTPFNESLYSGVVGEAKLGVKLVDGFKKCIPWVISLPIAAFVGYGLVKLAGFVNKESEHLRWPISIVLGAGVIISIKLLFEKLWYAQGRSVALDSKSAASLVARTALSAVLLVAEAFLGATAIQVYSKLSSFNGDGALALWQAFLIALTISSPTLIYSAVKGYSEGIKSLDALDHYNLERLTGEKRAIEKNKVSVAEYEDDRSIWKKEHDRLEELKDLVHKAKIEAIESERELIAVSKAKLTNASTKSAEMLGQNLEQQEQRMAEFESFRHSHDFQALCQSVSKVAILNMRIEELKQTLTNESISRGHGRKYVM